MNDLQHRLLSNCIVDSNDCWIWTRAKRNGYGCMKVEGNLCDTHRLSFTLYKGEIPCKLHVCHHCDNPACINPDHLFVGTHSDNMKDAFKKGRLKTGYEISTHQFVTGNIPNNRSITEEIARQIKKELKDDPEMLLKDIADKYKVSRFCITDIKRKRSFASVQV